LRRGLDFDPKTRTKRKECKIEEGYLHEDHAHKCISIPPKPAVSNVVGYLKGKSAISIARNELTGLQEL
jgi:REP element-mobilizing transposase RayT